jgi:hypothetical protein
MMHRRWGTWVGYLFFVALAVWIASVFDWRGEDSSMALLAFIPLPIGATFVYFSAYLAAWNLRRQNRAAEGPHTYSFSDAGLTCISPGVKSSLEWTNIAKVAESPEGLFFYISKTAATYLPKHSLREDELVRLRTDLRRWVGDRAALRS